VAESELGAGGEEILGREGRAWEDARELSRQAGLAERHPKFQIHGVTVTAKKTGETYSKCARSTLERHFPVRDTPTYTDPLHRTLVLPKPVTEEAAKLFNSLFGRRRPEPR
jgi:hypothetical protein